MIRSSLSLLVESKERRINMLEQELLTAHAKIMKLHEAILDISECETEGWDEDQLRATIRNVVVEFNLAPSDLN